MMHGGNAGQIGSSRDQNLSAAEFFLRGKAIARGDHRLRSSTKTASWPSDNVYMLSSISVSSCFRENQGPTRPAPAPTDYEDSFSTRHITPYIEPFESVRVVLFPGDGVYDSLSEASQSRGVVDE